MATRLPDQFAPIHAGAPATPTCCCCCCCCCCVGTVIGTTVLAVAGLGRTSADGVAPVPVMPTPGQPWGTGPNPWLPGQPQQWVAPQAGGQVVTTDPSVPPAGGAGPVSSPQWVAPQAGGHVVTTDPSVPPAVGAGPSSSPQWGAPAPGVQPWGPDAVPVPVAPGMHPTPVASGMPPAAFVPGGPAVGYGAQPAAPSSPSSWRGRARTAVVLALVALAPITAVVGGSVGTRFHNGFLWAVLVLVALWVTLGVLALSAPSTPPRARKWLVGSVVLVPVSLLAEFAVGLVTVLSWTNVIDDGHSHPWWGTPAALLTTTAVGLVLLVPYALVMRRRIGNLA